MKIATPEPCGGRGYLKGDAERLKDTSIPSKKQSIHPNSSEAQRRRLLTALQRGSITTLEARRELDILHPAGRVMELRRQGIEIDTAWIEQPTDEGRLHRVAHYILAIKGDYAMAHRNKAKARKLPPGTWVERDLFTSPAFLELTGFAPQLLILFLGKRQIGQDKQVLNKHSLTMTYTELEGVYVRHELGGKFQHLKMKGVSRPRIIRAIDNLLGHGFIEIIRPGGAYQHDKTVYGLTDDWMFWQPGAVIRQRKPDTRHLGYNGRKIKIAHETVPRHTHETVPQIQGLG